MDTKLLEKLRVTSEAEIYKQLYTDPLTGVLNRRAFDLLEKNQPFIAIIDVDSLKWVNDNHGHRAGDAHIMRLTKTLKGVFDENSIHRLSGDEFVIQGKSYENLLEKLLNCQEVVPFMSFGLGDNLEDADKDLRVQKQDREASGLRAARGECPPWI